MTTSNLIQDYVQGGYELRAYKDRATIAVMHKLAMLILSLEG
jgi:hypothetical protein